MGATAGCPWSVDQGVWGWGGCDPHLYTGTHLLVSKVSGCGARSLLMFPICNFSLMEVLMDKFIGYSARNPNAPASIKRRIASLRKQIAKEKKIANLLQKEQMLRDRLAMADRLAESK